jgi:hypothetical protein
MPLSAFYAWYLTRIMQRYRIPAERWVAMLEGPTQPSAANGAKVEAHGRPAAGVKSDADERQREANLG